MITLDTNIKFSSAYYYLLLKLKRAGVKTNGNIDKYIQAGSAQSTQNTKGVNGTNKCGNSSSINFEELIKLFKLNLPENRFAILMLLPKGELFELMKLLGKDALINGLKFFTKEKLMGFIWKLPKTDILKMLMHLFSDRKKIIENFPIKELKRFISSDKIEKGHLMKVFELMSREDLSKIMWGIDGKDHFHTPKAELMENFKHMKKFKLVNGIKRLDYKTMLDLITNMTEKYPKLYNEFSKAALFDVSARFAKVDLVKSLKVIDNDKIFDMLSELPDKLLALCVSQINPEVFSKILIKNHQDLLLKLLAA